MRELVLVWLILFSGSSGVHAVKPSPEAQRHEETGTIAYRLGQFPRAIEEFTKAFEISLVPLYLFNIAQAHRLGGDY